MGEFLTLDSKANGQVLADGSQFNPQFDWDGVVAVKIDDAALYDSPEDVINAIGDDAWIGRQDLRTIKNYLVCRVTFRNDDATPLDNARDGRPAFNAGLLGINQGENQGGSLIGITNAINRQDTRDGFCFRVEKGEEVSFYAIFEVPDEVDSDDLSIYYAVTIDDRYACKLTVRDCRG